MSRTYKDYVNVSDWILQCKKDPQYKEIKQEFSRFKSDETGLDEELIDDTIDRIVYEAD